MEPETVFMGFRQEWGAETAFGLEPQERRQHVYVLGQTGTGKSTLLRNMILQDIEAGRGVGVIDPHGDLVEDVLDHIPSWRTDDIVYFDPTARDPLALNVFRASTDNWHLVTSGVVSAFKKIWGDSWGPRLKYVLYATVSALLQCDNTSLLGVSRMLYDSRYRVWVVKQVKDPMVSGCPDIWELEGGDFAVIGADITHVSEALPPTASCGPDERIVRIPRKTLVHAKRDIPDSL